MTDIYDIINNSTLIQHLKAKIATNTDMIFDQQKKIDDLVLSIKGDLANDDILKLFKDQEQRIRALERKHTNPQGTTYTPEKISHNFQIDLLNNFINVLYPDIISFNQLAFSGFDIIGKKLGNLIGNGNVYFYLDEIRFECICSECEEVVDSKTSISDILDIEKNLIHPTFLKNSGWYICKACNKHFDTEEFLYDHHNSEHTVVSTAGNEIRGMKSDKPTVVINDDPDSSKIGGNINFMWYCDQCDGEFSSLMELASHRVSEHMGGSNITIGLDGSVEATPYLCGDCDKGFDTVEGITQHMLSEHNKVPYIESGPDITEHERQTVEFTFNNLDCGICEEAITDFTNIAIIGGELFDFDCVIEARKVSGGNMAGGKIPDRMDPTIDDIFRVHLLVNGVVEETYCDIEVTAPNSYFTTNIKQELASYQIWCPDCVYAKIDDLMKEMTIKEEENKSFTKKSCCEWWGANFGTHNSDCKTYMGDEE